MRGAIQSADSAFREEVSQIVKNVPIQAQDLALSAEAAREERSAATSSSTGSSAGGSVGTGSTGSVGSGSASVD
jgi:hypothetical protein